MNPGNCIRLLVGCNLIGMDIVEVGRQAHDADPGDVRIARDGRQQQLGDQAGLLVFGQHRGGRQPSCGAIRCGQSGVAAPFNGGP